MTPQELATLMGFLTSGVLLGVVGRWFDLVIGSVQGNSN